METDRGDNLVGSDTKWSEPSSYEEVVSALYPLQQEAEGENELSWGPPTNRHRQGARTHQATRRYRADSEELDFGLASLFEQTEDVGPTPGAAANEYSTSASSTSTETGSDWESIGEAAGQSEVPRTCFGEGLANARIEIRRLLLFSILQIRTDSPRLTSDVAWTSLTNRLIRERVYRSELEFSIAWRFAFGEPSGAHFRSVFESSLTEIRNLWREAGDE